jgi:hypothetical protein
MLESDVMLQGLQRHPLRFRRPFQRCQLVEWTGQDGRSPADADPQTSLNLLDRVASDRIVDAVSGSTGSSVVNNVG